MPSAALRLWRRAPAWRTCLVVAVLTSAVALLYAPWSPSQPQPQGNARYNPLTRAALLATIQTGWVIVAGRQVPLPDGEWHSLATEFRRNDPPINSEILIQIQDDRVTGIVLARGTTAPSDAARKLPYGTLCESSRALETRVVAVPQGVRECWGIVAAALPAAWRGPQADLIYVRALDTIQETHLDLPPLMLAAAWFHADATSWTMAEYYCDPAAAIPTRNQPEAWTKSAIARNSEATEFVKRLAHWTESWTPLLQKGLDGSLTEADRGVAASTYGPARPR